MLDGAGVLVLQMIAPPLALAVLIGIAAHVGQFGFLLTFAPLMLKLDKISPGKAIKKIFSLKNLIELLKNLIELLKSLLNRPLKNVARIARCKAPGAQRPRKRAVGDVSVKAYMSEANVMPKPHIK
ncbi:EscU/YscU/HrcU family type III secretion system export apparatus switch protein [Caldichromatium japonicum]|uniref:Flagellar biosynthetic protein FlhB n=1 Tax=Caldichromatium japonicum TaxID=2699430 RepID=A0A6G7VCY8_9GAMM|nr:EscU/YscU/HrcU family type III secretion system export apparatus switch protein [Caldichromatium japonicum]QIK37770.1 EscU/YscU/HrcU family type III secretion system export apparatus switch protein [Caldichromatium japonicum]